ncbi:MAG: dinitrogenase iron-molybdenum cofactor biosynthesis protein [Hyperthermus sp.]|nr:MAG: dinitrogenase iron-molybdenum cofactor biosynthesis protein [Hyperthermus sp.]
MPKIAIASEDSKGLDDVVASRFARAPKFTIVELDEKGEVQNIKIIDNPGAQATGGAAIKAIQALINEGVDIVIGPAFGPNAQAVLAEMKIKNMVIPAGTRIRDAIEKAKKEYGLT